MKQIPPLLFIWILVACSAPVDVPPPPTSIFTNPPPQSVFTPTPLPATPTPEVLPAPPTIPSALSLDDIPAYLTSVPENFNPDLCQDTRALQLLGDLKTALQTHDGELLASLVSPSAGVGMRYIRNGNVITYFDNIKFIFETTYEADWGPSPGSGEPVKGSFQIIVLPSLEKVFSSNPVIACNELNTGGATYTPAWPYKGMEFYSIHFPGTDEFGGMNWEIWAAGMVREQDQPMLASLVRFAWEP